MKVLIIEPHADDSLLSCYSLLQHDDIEATILTMCNHPDGRSSLELMNLLESVKSVNTIEGMTEDNYMWDSMGYNYRDVLYFDKSKNVYEHALDLMKCRPSYLTDRDNLVNLLIDVLKHMEYDQVLLPFGLMHPYHLLITTSCRSVFPNEKVNYYYELNHYNRASIKKRWIPDGWEYLGGDEGFHEWTDHEYDADRKFEIFKKTYPSEIHLMQGDKPGHLYGEGMALNTTMYKEVEKYD